MMKSMDTEGSELYDKYTTTWIALFHMTLGEYEVNIQDETINIRLGNCCYRFLRSKVNEITLVNTYIY